MRASDDTPRVEVIRDDEAESFRRGMQALRAQYKADEYARKAARAEAQKAAQYGLADSVYLLVTSIPSREGQPNRFKGEAISGLPDLSMSVEVYGESVDDVLFEARHAYISALSAASVEKTWSACRDRAAKASFEIAGIVGME